MIFIISQLLQMRPGYFCIEISCNHILHYTEIIYNEVTMMNVGVVSDMSIWHQPFTLEQLLALRNNTLDEYIGIRFVEIGEDFLRATMPIDRHTCQYMGIMHGGASCVLAETVGSVAANFAVDRERYYCVGLSIYTNHVRSIREGGEVSGTARAQHLGRSTQLWHIRIENRAEQDPDRRLISTTQLTMAVLEIKDNE